MLSTGWLGAARRACALGALLSCAFGSSGLFVGCSGSGDSGDSGDDGTGGTGSINLGLPAGARIVASINQPRGECMSAADCGGGAGAACATVAGGYRVCTFQPPVATMSSSLASLDQCGPSRACSSGKCYSVLNFAGGQCGSAAALTYNNCRQDGCTSDADCPMGVCGPRGFSSEEKISGGPIRVCLPAACKSSAECLGQANGLCALVQAGCGIAADGTPTEFLPAQLACVYPRGCTTASDCPREDGSYSYCRVVRGEGVCVIK
jgi:hypothetical protein